MILVEHQVILTSETASFKFTYKAMSDVEDFPLPPTHMHIHMHTSTYAFFPRIMIHKTAALLTAGQLSITFSTYWLDRSGSKNYFMSYLAY